MKYIYIFIFLPALLWVGCTPQKYIHQKHAFSINYPATQEVDTVTTYHNHSVADPYRWLEDLESADTKDWIEQQRAFEKSYFQNFDEVDDIRKRLDELDKINIKMSPPRNVLGKLFYKVKVGKAKYDHFFTDDMNGNPERFVSHKDFSDNGSVIQNSFDFHDKKPYVAFVLKTLGKDLSSIVVMNYKTKEFLQDTIKGTLYCTPYWGDNGIYYSKPIITDKGNENVSATQHLNIYYHKLGEDQSQDKLIFTYDDPTKFSYIRGISDDKRYLYIHVGDSGINYLKVLDTQDNNRVYSLDNETAFFRNVVYAKNGEFYFVSEENSKFRKLFKVSLEDKSLSPSLFIDEIEGLEISGIVNIINGHVYLLLQDQKKSRIYKYDTDGNFVKEISLPEGMIEDYSHAGYFIFKFPTTPSILYKIDFENDTFSPVYEKSASLAHDKFDVQTVNYMSKDSTICPMFIISQKGMKLDGKNPVLINTYGGYGLRNVPRFRPIFQVFLEQGGVIALPGVRGEGINGREWHESAIKENKQRTFDDLIAAAEYLVEKKITSPELIALEGYSYGGLTINASMLQRPDLFKVITAYYGPYDMLRFHKFTSGKSWVTEFGSSDDKEMFKHIYKYSPLHNVKKQNYPAILLTTSIVDQRVIPSHTYKYGATLQKYQNSDNPIVISICPPMTHGGDIINNYLAQQLAFIFNNLGMKYKNVVN